MIDAIAAYWNERIHDLEMTEAPVGTREFFDDLDEYRFDKLHYLPRLVDFNGYRGRDLLEVGCGIGTDLVRFARGGARVTGVDLSATAIDLARRNFALHDLVPDDLRVENAEVLPFDSDRFDVVYAHGVVQYTADPARLVRECHRVLRPGGTFAWVAWQRSERPYAPDRIANEVLDEFGFDPPEADSWCGDVASPTAAALAMRRAGFRDVRAWVGEVAHPWDPPGYLDFLTQFDEESLFAELEPAERREIERTILERIGRLTPEELTLRLPTVYALGRAAG